VEELKRYLAASDKERDRFVPIGDRARCLTVIGGRLKATVQTNAEELKQLRQAPVWPFNCWFI